MHRPGPNRHKPTEGKNYKPLARQKQERLKYGIPMYEQYKEEPLKTERKVER